MLFALFLFFIADPVISVRNVDNEDQRIYFLKCLLEEKNEPCQLVSDDSFSRNVSLLSPQVVREIYKLDENVLHAISIQNFSILGQQNLLSVPRGILILLPICHLSMVDHEIIKKLLDHWKKDEIVFKHLINSILYSKKLAILSEILQAQDISDENLRWIAEMIFSNMSPERGIFTGKLPLIFYSPPEAIIFTDKYEKFYLLSITNKPADFRSSCSSNCLLRFWANTMFKNNFPEPLENWTYLYTQRWGYILTGASTAELWRLNENSFSVLADLFNLNFTHIQIRFLYDKFHGKKLFYNQEYNHLPDAVASLLPHQLTNISFDVEFEHLILPLKKSLPTAKQILEMMAVKHTEKLKLQDISYPYSKFSYALPLEIFILHINHTLNISNVMKIQSNRLTESQMYFLSRGGKIFNFSSEEIFKYTELLHMVPTADIFFNQYASHVLLHLLANINPNNIPQVFAVLNKLWPELGSESVLKHVLHNEQSTRILEYLPSRFIIDFVENLIRVIQTTKKLYNLPEKLVSSISKKLKEVETNFQPFNVNEKYTFLYSTISCEDILSLDPYYFTYSIAKFNRYRKFNGKAFPTKLHVCSVNKLIELLQLKSFLINQPKGESKLSLLNEEEIISVGGFIFSALPPKAIKQSKNAKVIIKSIGSLSVFELISATSLKQLNELSSILAEEVNFNYELSSPLFDIGNLSLFLERKYIKKINGEYFQLFLESGYIDNRLCADQETRSSWFSLLTHVFGETSKWTYQTLVTLGDFLIVVPLSELNNISHKAWMYAADIINTKYFDSYELESDNTFYKVCLSRLPQNEKEIYLNDLRKLIKTLVIAAQIQINSLVPANQLYKNRATKNFENVFNFINSNRDIQFSFPLDDIEIRNSTDLSSTMSSVMINEDSNQLENTSHLVTILHGFPTEDSGFTESATNHLTEYMVNSNSTVAYQLSTSTEESISTDHLNIFLQTNSFNKSTTASNPFYFIQVLSALFSNNEPMINSNINLPNEKGTNQTIINNEVVESLSETLSQTTSSNELTAINFTSAKELFQSDKPTDATAYFISMSEIKPEYSEFPSKPSDSEEIFSPSDIVNLLLNQTSLEKSTSPSFQINNFDKIVNEGISSLGSILPSLAYYKQHTNKSYIYTVNEVPNVSTVLIGTNNSDNSSINSFHYESTPNHSIMYNSSFPDTTAFPYSLNSSGSVFNLDYYWHAKTNSEDSNTLSDYSSDNFPTSSTNGRKIYWNKVPYNETSILKDPVFGAENYSLYPEVFLNFTEWNNASDMPSFTVIGMHKDDSVKLNSVNKNPAKYFSQHHSDSPKLFPNPQVINNKKLYNNMNIHPKMLDLISKNMANYRTKFLEAENQSKKILNLSSHYSLYNNSILKKGVADSIVHENNTKAQSMNTNIKLISNKNVAEIFPKDIHKRSIIKWSCTALKMVGKSTEIILDESIINSLDDEDLLDCIDLFAVMDLPNKIQIMIWKRIHLDNVILSGKVIAAANEFELRSLNISIYEPWALEKIHLLGKYNFNNDVRQYIVKEVWGNVVKPLPLEVIVSLGSLVCELPDISKDVIKPQVLFKSALILGKELPCNHTCLSILSNLAIDSDTFKDPTKWTFSDVQDLGILVAGLNMNWWKKLILRNHEALAGLSDATFDCLPYKYIKMLREIDSNALPIKISRKLEQGFQNEINFNFFESTIPQETHLSSATTTYILPVLHLMVLCLVIIL